MIIDELFESPQQCPECGGISFSDLILAEKKDACYHKVKASAKVWPSAYASGRLVQCRKKGSANYGNKSEGVAEGSGESYIIVRTDAEGKKDVFAGNFDTYERAQKELDDCLAHPLHTKYKQKFEIKRKGGEQGMAEGSDEIRTAGRGAIRIPGDMSAPQWREPTWSFQEIAQKLGIPVSALNLLAFNRVGGFPEALPGLAARHGSKKYYKQSEIKRWVNANNVREKLKQGMAEAKPPGLRRDPLDLPPLEGPGSGGGSGGGGTSPRWSSTKIPGVDVHTGPPPTVTKPPNINRQIDPVSDVPAYVRRGLPDPVTTPVGKPKITVRPGETQSQAMQRTKAEQEFGKFLQGQGGQSFGTAGAGRGGQGGPTAAQATSGSNQIPTIKLPNGQTIPDPARLSPSGQYNTQSGSSTRRDSIDKIERDDKIAVDAMVNRAKQSVADREARIKVQPSWKNRDTDVDLEEASRKKREEPEVDYDAIDHDKSVARLKHLAGLGPMKTVYDPKKRQYRNMPTAQQPKK
jgi:hypothetical protein